VSPKRSWSGRLTTGTVARTFRTFGPCVGLFAPGTDITTGAWTADDATVTSGGTSLSAPIAASAAAVYLAVHPSAAPAEVSDALVGCATKGVISDPARRIAGPASKRTLRRSCRH
jgi:subtilisin family serine protease